MSNWELIDYNPLTGVSKFLGDHPEDSEGVLVKTVQDPAAVKQILDRNQAVATDSWDKRSDLWEAGHVPHEVLTMWMANGIDYMKYTTCSLTRKKINAMLNSNEYHKLRFRHFMI